MKLLVIGNSYTFHYDVPKPLAGLERDNGKNMQVYSVTQGGRNSTASGTVRAW